MRKHFDQGPRQTPASRPASTLPETAGIAVTLRAMHSDRDPIVAIATGAGRSAIGIVRVSGRDIEPIIEGVLGASVARDLPPRMARLTPFLDAQGRPIDEGLALRFSAPLSYTGENVLELQGHGGPVVLRLVLARCLEAGRPIGARIAEPGEFTRRAYQNDRLDLAQAEAVADLIDAGTAAAARGAVRSLQGEFSRAARALAEELADLRALTEATLDFPDEEIDFLHAADALARLERAAGSLEQMLGSARQGALLREGLSVALVGAPNVGKSSLLNALAGEDVAIVAEQPGTTRDRIERIIDLDGLALRIIDTAGLRPTDDPVERLGIERTLAAASTADLVLLVADDRQPSAGDPPEGPRAGQAAAHPGASMLHLPASATKLMLRNKIDLSGAQPGVRSGTIYVSAKTGAGMAELRAQLLEAAGWSAGAAGETPFLARARHLNALDRAAAHLNAARAHGAATARNLELFAEDLRLAADALGEITGGVSSDELLGRIFSRFCIGK